MTLGQVPLRQSLRSPPLAARMRARDVQPRFACQDREISEYLGRKRWVVKCTLTYLKHLLHFNTCFESRVDVYLAFLAFHCTLVYLNQAHAEAFVVQSHDVIACQAASRYTPPSEARAFG